MLLLEFFAPLLRDSRVPKLPIRNIIRSGLTILAFYLAYLLAFYLAYLLAFYLAYLLAFYLTFYLAYLLAYLLAFYLPVEVQRCPLSSEGPRLRSSSAH